MESGNSSPTPGQSGQVDREDEELDDFDYAVEQSHRSSTPDDNNSEAIATSRDYEIDYENGPGPSSRARQPDAEPSENGIVSRPVVDSDDEIVESPKYERRDSVDSDSRDGWAPASSSEVHESFMNFSPRPSNWRTSAVPQSASWSISSTSTASSIVSLASSAVSIQSSSQAHRRSPIPSTSTHGEISNPPSPVGGESGSRRGHRYQSQAEPGSSSSQGVNAYEVPGPSGYMVPSSPAGSSSRQDLPESNDENNRLDLRVGENVDPFPEVFIGDPANAPGPSQRDVEPGPSTHRPRCEISPGSSSSNQRSLSPGMSAAYPANGSSPRPVLNEVNVAVNSEAGPSGYHGILENVNLVHGEISNPPSPLGGQVGDSDMRVADSPEVGPSGRFFGPSYIPEPTSNPSSPQAGPSTGVVRRRPPDSVGQNCKRSRFEPMPGSSQVLNRQNLSVSSSEAVASSHEPPSPSLPQSPGMPHTPADNYQISSSTGLVDSVPPTPYSDQAENNDLSIPSPLVNNSRRVNQDTDDGVDSTVDSSGFVLARQHHLEDSSEDEEVLSADQPDDMASGFVQSSHRDDSSDESNADEAILSVNLLSCPSQGNSNDAITTSGQVDESNALCRRPEPGYEEPMPGPSTSNQENNLEAVSGRPSVEELHIQSHDQMILPQHPHVDLEYPRRALSGALPLPDPRRIEVSIHASTSAEASRFFDLLSDAQPSTSKSFHNSGGQDFNDVGPSNGIEVPGPSLAELKENHDGRVESEPSKFASSSDESGKHFESFLHEFDASNEVNLSASFPPIDGHPVDLEDIQIQNLGADHFCAPSRSAAPGIDSTSATQHPRSGSSVSSSGGDHPPFSIGLAFTGIPASFTESSPSTSGMTGPLSKRLRTLHSLQLQKENSKPKEDGEDSTTPKESASFPSTSHQQRNSNDRNDDEDSDGDQNLFLGGTQQTFSVTIETMGGGAAIKPKKFFQQKSAVDLQHEQLTDEKNFGGNSFNSFPALMSPDKDDGSIAQSKGKRLKKSLISWCKDCQIHYTQDCPGHRKVLQISDQPVMSRARASLPSNYLVIKKVDNSEFGVFAKKLIPQACRFGPVEGRLVGPLPSFDESPLKFQLLLKNVDGTVSQIDVSDEENSNWMRFVRPATSEEDQNAVLTQENGRLYFTITRDVHSRHELRVWYSRNYAESFEPTHRLHLLGDHGLSSWSCYDCSQQFQSPQALKDHLHLHENQENVSQQCKENSGPKESRVDNNCARKYPCHICSRNFDRQFSLQRHLALHRGDKSFKCDSCPAKFSLQFNLSRHKRKMHNEDSREATSQCVTCGMRFGMSALLKIHNLSHQSQVDNNSLEFCYDDDSYRCPLCSELFIFCRDLVAHSTQHGEPQDGSLGDESSEAKDKKMVHKCELCYKAFASAERLERHMAVHGSEESKPLSCEHCGKRFLSNSALACHVKVHSDDANIYDCPICSLTFEQIHLLKDHVHLHRHNGIYTCPHCAKNFKEYAQIRKHIRAFHAEKKFHCPHCEKSFTGADKLKAHLVKHFDVREFRCETCGKEFKRRDKLKDHIKRIHSADKKNKTAKKEKNTCDKTSPKLPPKVAPTDYHRFIYKCHDCLLGFKRRGMLVNHLAKRHPDKTPQNVPELNLPILKTTKDYYCQYCSKVYKSSSKRKVHILKNHPGSKLPPSVRDKSAMADCQDPNPTYSATVGSVTSQPYSCNFCHKQYASNAKLLQHLRKKHEHEVRDIPRRSSDHSTTKSPSVESFVTVDIARDDHLVNYPSTSNGIHRVPRTQEGNLDFSEISLGQATLVPLHSARGELTHGLEYRTIDGEVLQLQLTRVPQSEALRLASSGATVIHVPGGDLPVQHPPENVENNGPASHSDLVVYNREVQGPSYETPAAASASASSSAGNLADEDPNHSRSAN